jgi:hypothetical protein
MTRGIWRTQWIWCRLNLQNHNLKTCKLVQPLCNPLQCLVRNILMYAISCMRVVMPTFSLPLPFRECISKFIRNIVCPGLFSVKTKFMIHFCPVFFLYTWWSIIYLSDKISVHQIGPGKTFLTGCPCTHMDIFEFSFLITQVTVD